MPGVNSQARRDALVIESAVTVLARSGRLRLRLCWPFDYGWGMVMSAHGDNTPCDTIRRTRRVRGER